MDLSNEEDDYNDDSMKSIGECLAESMQELDRRFRHATRLEWDIAKTNRSISARNRMMADVGVSLGIPYVEMPLISEEDAA